MGNVEGGKMMIGFERELRFGKSVAVFFLLRGLTGRSSGLDAESVGDTTSCELRSGMLYGAALYLLSYFTRIALELV